MYRRTVLGGIGAVLLAGCSTDHRPDIGTDSNETMQTGIVEALAVEQRPPSADVTARSDLQNQYVREVVTRVCDDGNDEGRVRVEGEGVDAVKAQLRDLPAYSPPSGSEYEYGNYVACDDQYVVVRLMIED